MSPSSWAFGFPLHGVVLEQGIPTLRQTDGRTETPGTRQGGQRAHRPAWRPPPGGPTTVPAVPPSLPAHSLCPRARTPRSPSSTAPRPALGPTPLPRLCCASVSPLSAFLLYLWASFPQRRGLTGFGPVLPEIIKLEPEVRESLSVWAPGRRQQLHVERMGTAFQSGFRRPHARAPRCDAGRHSPRGRPPVLGDQPAGKGQTSTVIRGEGGDQGRRVQLR